MQRRASDRAIDPSGPPRTLRSRLSQLRNASQHRWNVVRGMDGAFTPCLSRRLTARACSFSSLNLPSGNNTCATSSRGRPLGTAASRIRSCVSSHLPAPLEDLVRLFTLCSVHGWPKHLARATVSTLAKVQQPQGMQHGRPITVFANLYRLWASGVAKAVLSHWSRWLPQGVVGSVPGRSVRDLSLALECQVEQHLLHSTPFAGFSIDVVKCFNQLPRVPLRFLLAHLGFPEPLLHAWFDWLDCCHRLPVFHGSIGPPVLSCTGMPEGCPLSVVAQVAVCWAAQVHHMSFGAEHSSYVDNFTWTGTTVESLAEALMTDKKLRLWLLGPAQQLLPPDSRLAVVQSAKDLGVAFKFRRINSLDASAKRIAEGHRRLDELQKPGIALLNKARIVQTSIWPATFYGFEARLLSPDQVSKLRTGACRTLIGPRHIVQALS